LAAANAFDQVTSGQDQVRPLVAQPGAETLWRKADRSCEVSPQRIGKRRRVICLVLDIAET